MDGLAERVADEICSRNMVVSRKTALLMARDILAIPEIAEVLAARAADVAETLDECRAMDDDGARDLRRFNTPPA
jgi:hypothetical protein